MKIYKCCNDCPHSEIVNGIKDDDGWTMMRDTLCCGHVALKRCPRYVGESHTCLGQGKTIPTRISPPSWCPLNQENYAEELDLATVKAKEYGGKPIERPFEPKSSRCENQKEPENRDPYYAWQGTEYNCYTCEHSFYITVNGKIFWCCKYGEIS